MPSEDKHTWKRHMRIEVEIRLRRHLGWKTPLEARKRHRKGWSAIFYRFQSMALLTPHDVELLA